MSRPAPLVFVHGFPLDARMWHGAVPARGARAVLCLDLPGFRGTAALRPPGTMAGYARWLLEQARAFADGPYVFVGLSMGGYVVFEVARQAGEQIAGLVLADTRAEPDSGEGRAARDEAMAMIREGRRTEFLAGFGARLLSARATASAELTGGLRAMMKEATDEGLRYGLEAIRDRADSRALLSTIVAPTLVIVGEEDAVTPLASAETLQQGIRGSRLAVIPQSGHIPPMENPEAFRSVVDGFLDSSGL